MLPASVFLVQKLQLFVLISVCSGFLFLLLLLPLCVKGLDFVIAEARRNGIKLILSLANNYESFGGKKQYVNWARNGGHYLNSDDDFFTDSVVKGFYKNHIRVRIFLIIYFNFSFLA